VKFYPQDKRPTMGDVPRHKVPRRKKRQAKKPKPRDSFDVDRDILVTETEEDFLHAERK